MWIIFLNLCCKFGGNQSNRCFQIPDSISLPLTVEIGTTQPVKTFWCERQLYEALDVIILDCLLSRNERLCTPVRLAIILCPIKGSSAKAFHSLKLSTANPGLCHSQFKMNVRWTRPVYPSGPSRIFTDLNVGNLRFSFMRNALRLILPTYFCLQGKTIVRIFTFAPISQSHSFQENAWWKHIVISWLMNTI